MPPSVSAHRGTCRLTPTEYGHQNPIRDDGRLSHSNLHLIFPSFSTMARLACAAPCNFGRAPQWAQAQQRQQTEQPLHSESSGKVPGQGGLPPGAPAARQDSLQFVHGGAGALT